MLLYLVQHAQARREEEDPRRDLSDQGRRDLQQVAAFLAKSSRTVSRIVHSGKTRAASTAAILAGALKPSRGVAAADGLAPLDNPEIWGARIGQLAEDTALVGHLPHLARLAGLLLAEDAAKNLINFQMGGVVCLRRSEEGPWAVEWMVVPELLG